MHVHMATNLHKVRRNSDAWIKVDLNRMDVDDIAIFISLQGVILTAGYFEVNGYHLGISVRDYVREARYCGGHLASGQRTRRRW